MNALFQKIKNFFAKIWQAIKLFFSKIAQKWNNFLIKLGNGLFKLRNKIRSVFKRKNPKQKSRNDQPKNTSDTCQQETQNENKSASQTSTARTEQSADPQSEKTNQPETPETNSSPAPQKPKSSSRFFAITGNIFDVLTDLLFGFALILRLKPDIFKNPNIFQFTVSVTVSEKIKVIIANLPDPLNLTELAKDHPAIVAAFLGILILYFLLKLIFSFFITKSPQKLLSALLVFIGILTVSMALDKFLLFLMFYILLYFAHQLSCKIAPKTAAIKLGTIFLLDIILYLALHFFYNPCLIEIFKPFTLPINGRI